MSSTTYRAAARRRYARPITGDTPPAEAAITVALNLASLSVPQGESGVRSVTVTPSGGYTGLVALVASSLPAGASVVWDDDTVEGGSGVRTFTVNVDGAAAPIAGDAVTITATGSGVDPATAILALTITEPVTAGLRQAPSPAMQFLLGPQPEVGLVPAGMTIPDNLYAGYDYRLATLVTQLTAPQWEAGDGTVNVVNGSPVVQGVGTTEFGVNSTLDGTLDGRIRIYDAAASRWRYFYIWSANAGAQTIRLSVPEVPDVPWPGTTQNGLTYEKMSETPTAGNSSIPNSDWDLFNYYDAVYGVAQEWMWRDNCDAGSPLLAAVRAILDVQRTRPNHGNFADLKAGGTTLGWPNSPRNSGFHGIVFGAMDQYPEWWPTILDYVNTAANAWLERHRVGYPLDGVEPLVTRDAGYTLQFMANVAVCHPDEATRDSFAERVIALALDPCIRVANEFSTSPRRLRWLNGYLNFDANDDGFYDYGSGPDGVVGGGGTNVSQPFQDSLMVEGLITVHRMMRYHGMTTDARYATIGDAILAATEGWICSYVSPATYPALTTTRYIPYLSGKNDHFWRVDSAFNAGDPVDYSRPFLTGLIGAPADFGVSSGGAAELGDNMNDDRQAAADGVHMLGYCHAMTGDARYKAIHDEITDAMLSGTDGSKSFWDQPDWKGVNQHWGNGCITKGVAYFHSGLEDFS